MGRFSEAIKAEVEAGNFSREHQPSPPVEPAPPRTSDDELLARVLRRILDQYPVRLGHLLLCVDTAVPVSADEAAAIKRACGLDLG